MRPVAPKLGKVNEGVDINVEEGKINQLGDWLLETNLSNRVSQYSPAPVVNIVPMLGKVHYKEELLWNSYQKQTTAMMATRIGFFTFFKLGWSNKVDSTPWRKSVQIGSRELEDKNASLTFVIPPPWSQSENQVRVRGACRRKGKTRWEPQGSVMSIRIN